MIYQGKSYSLFADYPCVLEETTAEKVFLTVPQ